LLSEKRMMALNMVRRFVYFVFSLFRI